MNSSYQVNRFYAQERVDAQLQAGAKHRQNRQDRAGYGVTFTTAARRTYSLLGRVTSHAAHSLEALAKARVTPVGN
jgi:hypothetical protein